ncbi:hypothetical protein Acr_00g0055760 [Actinidia rufa]|uniref:Uncharacterized protein n=1 Tax=Actinidia rufa TaxID=165716 RepID=A0A7J0DM96_9ERIC|nr:hypothetical protein Acr_00g0055760 [Actinidia rufa]
MEGQCADDCVAGDHPVGESMWKIINSSKVCLGAANLGDCYTNSLRGNSVVFSDHHLRNQVPLRNLTVRLGEVFTAEIALRGKSPEANEDPAISNQVSVEFVEARAPTVATPEEMEEESEKYEQEVEMPRGSTEDILVDYVRYEREMTEARIHQHKNTLCVGVPCEAIAWDVQYGVECVAQTLGYPPKTGVVELPT